MILKPMRKFCAVVMATLLILGFLARVPSARAVAEADCSTSKEIGKKIPLLMVHGFAAGSDMWSKGSPSMESVVSGLTNVYVEPAFNYADSNTAWVTDSNIGPKLAKRIDCLAQASRQGGGKGKVIVVAHSMGGLATRYASGQTVEGRKVSDELGLVIMIGTPSLGSWGGTACQITTWVKQNLSWCEGDAPEAMAVYGDKLKALPHFPSRIAVKTIAGSVTAVNSLFWTVVTVAAKSDLLVPVSSALTGASDPGKGGGKETVACIGITPIHGLSQAPCEHGKLPNNPKVQAAVKSSIQAYLKSLEPKVKFTGKLVLNGLQIPTSPNWEVRGIADYPDGNQGAVYDMTTCKRTAQPDYWKACARFFVDLDGGHWLNIMKNACPDLKLVEKGAKVGNLAASVYKITRCDALEISNHAYLWHVPGKLAIQVNPSYPQGREMEGAREAFAAATWK